MSRTIAPAASSKSLLRTIALAALVLLSLLGLGTQAAAQDALKFGNNYFVTGDYVVGGVGLRALGDKKTGLATGIIHIPDAAPNTYLAPGISGSNAVPAGAQIVAAFLYWETIEDSPGPHTGQNGFFRGYPISGVPLSSSSTNGPVAWSNGGCTGGSNGTKSMQPYRADVLALLPQDANGNVLANGQYEVKLPDSGSQSSDPVTLGATLVIIYRVLSPNFPLNAIILYDGAFSPTNGSAPMTQTIQGFYQPAAVPFARLTHIAGNGQSNKYEQVLIGSTTPPANALNPLGTAAFPGFYNSSWDNPTWNVSPFVLPADTSENTEVLPNANQSGCVSWGAAIFSTTVQSSDGDGLLDVWKANGGYTDVGTGQHVDLTGATPGHKDVFVQLDYIMNSTAGTSFAPNANALSMVQTALQAHDVYLHFGIGDGSPVTGRAIDEATEPAVQACSDNLSASPPQYCIYPGQSGVVVWTPGFFYLKNEPLNMSETDCEQNLATCVRRFNSALKDSYRYVLFGDRLGAPGWNFVGKTLTSVSQSGNTVTFNISVPHGLVVNDSTYPPNGRVTVYGAISNLFLNGTYLVTSVTCPKRPGTQIRDCSSTNTAPGPYTFTITIGGSGKNATYTLATDPNLAVGSGKTGTTSGISDVGGANSVITLGGWGIDGTTDAVQAGTLMHELGHAFSLTHGGFYFDKLTATNNDYTPTVEANCKSNMQSVMNYMFQVDLLDKITLDPSGTLLVVNVPDYSEQNLIPLSEDSLAGVTALTTADVPPQVGGQATTYSTTQWYALAPQNGITQTPAKAHCDGSPLVTTDPDQPMYRWAGPTSSLPWSNSGYLDSNGKLDINYDALFEVAGATPPPYGLRGYNDWNHLDLRQVGAAGSVTVAGGGQFINGGGQFINGGGQFINGGGQFINGGGQFINGGGQFINGGGQFINGGSGGEFTFEAANSVTHAPKALTAVVITTPLPRYIQLTWPKPFGDIGSYNVYRSANDGTFTKIDSLAAPAGTTITYNDKTATCPNTYAYFVTAVLAGTTPPQESGPSPTAPPPPSTLSVCAPPYIFTGYFSPLKTASDTSYSGTFPIGNPVPVLWTLQLQDNSYVSNKDVNTLLAIGPVPLVNGACPTPGQVQVFFNHTGAYPYSVSTLYSLQAGLLSGNTFTYNTSNNQFTYGWSTNSLATGCYVIELDLDSGQVERTALKLATPYTFIGFGSPLATADPPNTGSYSGTSKLGNSTTVKWQLKNSSGKYVSTLNVNTLYVTGPFTPFTSGSACQTTQAPLISSYSGTLPGNVQVLFSPSVGTKGNSTFRYDPKANQFIFNWDTSTNVNTGQANVPGCYVLELDLDSGQVERTSINQTP